jgi:hypothetical protein
MRSLVVAAAFGLLIPLAASPAAARIDCSPNCDFTHYYGPLDLSWQRPGLTCYSRCDARGNCAPTPACFVQAPPAGRSAFATGWVGERRFGRITVRSRQAPR